MLKTVFAILVLIASVGELTAAGNKSDTYRRTRKILTAMEDEHLNDEELAKLFRVGDERISDLMRALDDKDKDISLRAQVVIRYLANAEGMRALFERYRNGKDSRVRGAVPVPLSEWDYNFIEQNYLKENQLSWHGREFMYALALDGSPKASTMLDKMLERFDKHDGFSATDISRPFSGDKDVSQLVLENAFFVSPEDRQYTCSRLLALNGAKNKALVEIYVNRDVLMEEWYHVVVSKSENGWKFLSITMVAQS